jgi:hypothetical protein
MVVSERYVTQDIPLRDYRGLSRPVDKRIVKSKKLFNSSHNEATQLLYRNAILPLSSIPHIHVVAIASVIANHQAHPHRH